MSDAQRLIAVALGEVGYREKSSNSFLDDQQANAGSGNAVKNAQAILIQHGFACGGRIVAGRENPDGEFGLATEKAVKSFQHLRALEADGVVGKDTWTTLLIT